MSHTVPLQAGLQTEKNALEADLPILQKVSAKKTSFPLTWLEEISSALSDAIGLIQYEESDKVQGFFFFYGFHIHNQALGNLPSHMLRNKNVLPSVCF